MIMIIVMTICFCGRVMRNVFGDGNGKAIYVGKLNFKKIYDFILVRGKHILVNIALFCCQLFSDPM